MNICTHEYMNKFSHFRARARMHICTYAHMFAQSVRRKIYHALKQNKKCPQNCEHFTNCVSAKLPRFKIADINSPLLSCF